MNPDRLSVSWLPIHTIGTPYSTEVSRLLKPGAKSSLRSGQKGIKLSGYNMKTHFLAKPLAIFRQRDFPRLSPGQHLVNTHPVD